MPQHISLLGETMFSGTDWQNTARTSSEFTGVTTFDNFFLLTKGESLLSTYHYTTPNVVMKEGDLQTYRLDVYKQAGTQNEPLLVNITLPEGRTFLSATPEPTTLSPTTIRFTGTLSENQTFIIQFE